MGTPSKPVVKSARRSHDGMIPESSVDRVFARLWSSAACVAGSVRVAGVRCLLLRSSL